MGRETHVGAPEVGVERHVGRRALEHERHEPRRAAERPDDGDALDRLAVDREQGRLGHRVEAAELASRVRKEARVVEVADGDDGEHDEERRRGARDDGERRQDAEAVHERAAKVVRQRRVDAFEVLREPVLQFGESQRAHRERKGEEEEEEEPEEGLERTWMRPRA